MKRTLLRSVVVATVLAVAAPAVTFAMTSGTTGVDPATEAVRPEEPQEGAGDRSAAVGYGLAALGAALAVGLTALGTGYAQGKIGTAGGGALAEKPELAGTMIILVAIPETAVIMGFVIAFFLLGKL